MSDSTTEKRLAAEAAAELVEDGMLVGLGTGSTVAHLLPALAAARPARSAASRPPSRPRTRRASSGSPVEPFESLERLDIAIDGADQIAPDGWLVKGGGGAHTREKIVAAAAERFVVIADSSKPVERITAPIPLELLRFGLAATLRELGDAVLREGTAPSPDGGVIADYLGEIAGPTGLAGRLQPTPGVVDHGLFPPTLVADVIVARGDGSSAPPTRSNASLAADRLRAAQQRRLARPHPARRNRGIARPQLRQGVALVGARDQPEDLARRLERRVGERHPAPSLVLAGGDRDRAVGDLEHRVAGDERGGVAVGPEAEVDEVELVRELGRVARGRGRRGRASVTGIGRRRSSAGAGEAREQVGEVAVGVAVGGDPLVDLEQRRSAAHSSSVLAEQLEHPPRARGRR